MECIIKPNIYRLSDNLYKLHAVDFFNILQLPQSSFQRYFSRGNSHMLSIHRGSRIDAIHVSTRTQFERTRTRMRTREEWRNRDM